MESPILQPTVLLVESKRELKVLRGCGRLHRPSSVESKRELKECAGGLVVCLGLGAVIVIIVFGLRDYGLGEVVGVRVSEGER